MGRTAPGLQVMIRLILIFNIIASNKLNAKRLMNLVKFDQHEQDAGQDSRCRQRHGQKVDYQRNECI